MALVEVDDVPQRLHRRPGSQLAEKPAQVRFELVEQNGQLGIVVFTDVRNVGGIDDHRAGLAHHVDRLIDERVRRRVIAEQLVARDADPRALQPAGVE